MTAIFGESYKAYEFTNYQDGEMSFSQTTTLRAGTPYIVYSANPATDSDNGYVVRNVEFASAAEVSIGGVTFRSTFSPVAAPGMSGLYGVNPSNGHIMKGGNQASLKGFRAFFELPAGLDASSITMNFDGDIVTGIGAIEIVKSISGEVYDLSGRKHSSKTLRRGIYIKDGQKFTVK